jgi:hypothetical protein
MISFHICVALKGPERWNKDVIIHADKVNKHTNILYFNEFQNKWFEATRDNLRTTSQPSHNQMHISH